MRYCIPIYAYVDVPAGTPIQESERADTIRAAVEAVLKNPMYRSMIGSQIRTTVLHTIVEKAMPVNGKVPGLDR